MTKSTERYITFKAIYTEDTGQYFFCDFFKAQNDNRYKVIVELAKQWVTEACFIQSGHTGQWEQEQPHTPVPATLLHTIAGYIHQAENDQLWQKQLSGNRQHLL